VLNERLRVDRSGRIDEAIERANDFKFGMGR
jgi:hypothetical protein